jgi:hypothetical protein
MFRHFHGSIRGPCYLSRKLVPGDGAAASAAARDSPLLTGAQQTIHHRLKLSKNRVRQSTLVDGFRFGRGLSDFVA